MATKVNSNEIFDSLSEEQRQALALLESGENVFLTGGAGSGKSYVVRAFRQSVSAKVFPLLASTGAAAVLIGGRTFHSFFGLGVMEGGIDNTVNRALQQKAVKKRLKEVEGVIIDEISMIPAEAFEAAEIIARESRGSQLPWGGMRVIVVGDFAQLPPVSNTKERPWCFKSPRWQESGFITCILKSNQRVQDPHFLQILNDVRQGRVTLAVKDYLEAHTVDHDPEDTSTRLFPRRAQADTFNQQELEKIPRPPVEIPTQFFGEAAAVERFRKLCPLPESLKLKIGCRVMFLQNDPQKRWVNGTIGTVSDISEQQLIIRKQGGREVSVDKSMFNYQNAEGNTIATALNFPVQLAYATTIHKSQGATLDSLWVDLAGLWEPGHAYVALSRLTQGSGLKLLRWNPRSFIVDPDVLRFYDLKDL